MLLFPLSALLGTGWWAFGAERPVPYLPDADRMALRSAAAGLTAVMDRMAGLPMEAARAGSLAAALDEAQGHAARARDAALGLEGSAGAAAAELGAYFRGGGREPGVERRLEEFKRDRNSGKDRFVRLVGQRKEVEDNLKKKKEPPKEKDKILELLKAAEEVVLEAEGALRASEKNDASLREGMDRMKDELRRALSAFAELASAAAGVRTRAEEFFSRSPAARAAFAALGRPPEAEARTRAWEKTDLLRDCSRGLFLSADSGGNREGDFSLRREAFLRQRVRFEAGLKEALASLEEARGKLDRAAKLVAQAASY